MAAIQRYGAAARYADKVVHNGTVYLVEVATSTDAGIAVQTTEVLASIERQLAEVGSDKSRLLMATIYLQDFADAPAFNAAWEAWLPAGCAPARACVRAELAHPGYRVEIALTAAVL
jgi:enamine deaminase RidA (YjgF/YER057c/UK114 family)